MSAASPYLMTLGRYACLAGLLALAMLLTYRALRRLRCADATAAGYAFITPWIVGFALFWLFAIGFSFFLGLTRYGVLSDPQWIGFDNYRAILFDDPVFRDAAWNTASFALFSVGLGLVSSLLAAVLLSLNARLMGLWRAIYYLPSVVPAVSTALLWRWIFVPDGGLINGLLAWVNGLLPAGLAVPLPGWFNDPDWVIPAFVIMTLQGAAGNNMVIFLARIKAIDQNLYEAAALDGAGAGRRFRHVTLPQLTPIIFYHLVMGIIGALQLFTQPMFVETPGRRGLFYAPYIYRTGWEELRMGYAAALSWVLFAALIVLTTVVFRTGRLWVSYEQSDVLPAGESTVTRPRGLHRLGWYLLVSLGGLVSLVPILWMVSTSLKSPADLFAMPPEPISWPLQWRNYLDAWRALPFTRFLLNTLFIVGLAVAAEVVMSAIVGYGFARFRFPGKRLAFAAMVSTMLIPGMVMMIPVFLIWRTAGLVGRFDPLVLTGLFGGTALFIFIAHQFFRTLPVELEEAARIDGASHGRIFCQIMLPLARPVLMVIALISFQTHWNDFLGPLLYLNELDQYTLTLGLHFFQGAFMGEAPRWHWMMAMTTLMAVPTVVLFLLTQRAIFGPRRPASHPDPRNPGQ